MLRDGDRVRLTRAGNPEGSVKGKELDGMVYVRLDSGQAASFPTSEVNALAPDESKSWPPAGIETK